jgi:acyl-CoA dehydrogenase
MSRFRSRAQDMARAAAEHADAVDTEARFPAEAFALARSGRLLGMLVPAELGGEGASVSDVAEVSYILGQACGSTSLIFSMHSIMVAILARHAAASPWHREFMNRIAAGQLLVASSTTEGLGGGDVRSSSCFVEPSGPRMKLAREATVLSYAAQADAILSTARRSADSAPSDQVLVALLKSDYQLEPIVGWNTLGMRGTCSQGFAIRADALAEQVLPVAYDTIHKHSMGPVAHLTWGSTWAGIAAGAVARARQFARLAARNAKGQLPPGTPHLTRATMSLRAMRAQLATALQRFEAAGSDAQALESLDFQTAMTLLKVGCSEAAIDAVMSALRACGLSGYREQGEFSVGRHLRDVLSSMIMINNDRILANATNAAMLGEVPGFLHD